MRLGRLKRAGCRPRGMASWNVHLDTWAIIEVLFGGRYAKLVAEILRLGGQHPYSLVVSQVALGEAAAVILRGGPDSGRMLLGMLRLLADSRIDPGRCMPPLSPRVLETTRELAAGAPELDTTDTVIAAQAIVDPNSAFLITRDRMLVGNPVIKRYEKAARAQELRNTGLRIVNPVETWPVFGAR